MGCNGQPLTIRSWLKVQPGATGNFQLGGPPASPLTAIGGGLLIKAALDPSTLVPGPLQGTVTVEVAKLAAMGPSIVGPICLSADKANPSTGTVSIDLVNGVGTAVITTNFLATTQLSAGLGVPPVSISQVETLDLAATDLGNFVNAALSGETDGLLATSLNFSGTTNLAGTDVAFSINADLSNDALPPAIDPSLTTFCNSFFAQQTTSTFYGINSKGSYLQQQPFDAIMAPLIIPLADVGAAPGDTLNLAVKGTFSDTVSISDGNDTRMTAVFSSSNALRGVFFPNRVVGAIDAGRDVRTAGDIRQDFRVNPSTSIKVPAGAKFLFVAANPNALFIDDTGFDFGVDVSVTH